MRPRTERTPLAQQMIYLRTMTGLTQPQLCALLGIQRAAYANYEAGRARPKEELLYKMAQVLGVAPEILLEPEQHLLSSAEERLNDNAYVASRGLSSLPEDEKTLIGLYRLLDEEERERLIRQLEKQSAGEP